MNVNKTGEIRVRLVDSVSVGFLIGMLQRRRARRRHGGKPAEGCMGSPCIVSYNHMCTNYFKKLKRRTKKDQQYIISAFSFKKYVFNHSVMSDSLQPHEPQHTRPPCPSPTPGIHPNPCPSNHLILCHPLFLLASIL